MFKDTREIQECIAVTETINSSKAGSQTFKQEETSVV